MHEISSQPLPEVDFKAIPCIQGFAKIKADFAPYLTDESKLSCSPFEFLFFPRNENELAAVIREMSRRKVPLTIAGARTGLVGGCVPQGGALVSLERLDAVESIVYDPSSAEWRVRAQTAISLKSLENLLRYKKFAELEKREDPLIREGVTQFIEDPHGYFYPPDPTEMSASLGGSVVTNASGARTYRYGPTRAWVRGIRVLLADGEVIDIPRGKYFSSPSGSFIFHNSKNETRMIQIPDYPLPRTKSTSGIYAAPQMDLIDLFIGSEGVFGIVTQIEVALLKREEKISIILFLESDEKALELTQALRSESSLQLDFLEFYSENAIALLKERQRTEPSTVGMPPLPDGDKAALFIEMSFDHRAKDFDYQTLEKVVLGCGASLEDSWAGYESRELDRFKVFRHLLPETINSIIAERKKIHPELHKLGTDLAVPDQYLQEMWDLYKSECERSDLEWVAFGHIGNNHIHVNILPRDMDDLQKALEIYSLFAQKAVQWGGAVSAEHGIGKIKIKFLKIMFSASQLSQMKKIKEVLDPLGLLNPGDIFPAGV